MSDHQFFLFLYTIGPVQSFISSARKTQDLWAGSYLLSYLLNIGLHKLQQSSGNNFNSELIFPHSNTSVQDDLALSPNRFLVQLSGSIDSRAVQKLAEDITHAIQDELSNIVAHGKQNFCDTTHVAPSELDDFSVSQIHDLLETYWVAMKLNTEMSYGSQYTELETALAARKNIRPFSQPRFEQSLKCSICGDREAVHKHSQITIPQVKSFWRQISSKSHKFSANEYLCFICLAKRMLPDYFKKEKKLFASGMFPSTAEVAMSGYKRKLTGELFKEYEIFENNKNLHISLKSRMLPYLKRHLVRQNSDTFDGQWFYPGTYKSAEKKAASIFLSPDQYKTLLMEFKQLHKAAQQKSIHAVPYYAVIMFDGDRMGDKLKAIPNLETHQQLSKSLADFAGQKVHDLIENKYLGKLIYAGGDDVLALVALDDLLPMMEALRLAFMTHFQVDHNNLGIFTGSCGVCISHFKNPFSVTLQIAREMEQWAKHDDKLLIDGPRNSFAIQVLSHSGNIKRSLCKWEVSDEIGNSNVVPQLRTLQTHFENNTISWRFIKTLHAEMTPLMDRTQPGILNVPFIDKELKRLMWRATDISRLKEYLVKIGYCAQDEATSERTKEYVSMLAENIFKAFSCMNANFYNFIALLEITRFIVKGESA